MGIVALHQNDYGTARQHFIDYFTMTRKPAEKIHVCDFLIGSATITAGMNQSDRAAKLYRVAQALLKRTGYKIQPFDEIEFDRHLQIARNQLGDARFEALAAQGGAMTMEWTIAYVLDN